MEGAKRQHHRLVIDAAARQYARGEYADSAFFITNFINAGVLRHHRPQRFPGANLLKNSFWQR